MGMTQLLQQLLPVTAVIQDVVGKNDVKTFRMDLAECLCCIARAMHINEAQ